MYPYFLVVLSILILHVKLSKRSNYNINLKIIFLILFFFAALRGNGNGDYFNYLNYSTYITSIDKVLDSKFPMEIGFRIISYVINTMRINQQAVIIIMNLISLMCIYIFIKRYSLDVIFSVLLFIPLYLMFDMHAARTAVAIGISVFSLKYLYEKNTFMYLVVIFLASCFHKSAWILIILYFIGNIRVDYSLRLLSVIVVLILSYLLSFSDIILGVLKLMGLNNFAVSYHSYMQSGDYGYSFKIYDPRLILLIAVFLFTIFSQENITRLQNILLNCLWINVLLMIVLREHIFFVTRLTSFFNIYTIILVPNRIYNYKNLGNTSTYVFLKILFIFIYLAYITALIVLTSVEYKFFYFK